MLSGIGPATSLRKHGIPVLVNLPGVGNNLQDHYVLSLACEPTFTSSVLANIIKMPINHRGMESVACLNQSWLSPRVLAEQMGRPLSLD